MSEIRFIQAQGDLLDAAIAEAPSRQPRAAGDRLRSSLRPRKRAAAVVVALAVAGCGVAAATGAFSASSARLATGLVDCNDGTGTTNSAVSFPKRTDALITDMPLPAGLAPTAACRRAIATDYRKSSLKAFGLSNIGKLKLVACVKNPTTTSVFISSGKADQCRQLGLEPLPSGFAATTASVQTLTRQLNKLYLSRDCWAPNALDAKARATIENEGFNGWQVVLRKPKPLNSTLAAMEGRCGAFSQTDANGSLDGRTRTLTLGLGIPLSTTRFITRAQNDIAARQWTSCYRASTIQATVDKAFASSGMTAKVATTTNPNGGKGFSWGTRAEARHYQSGCLILQNARPSTDDRIVYVWFISEHGIHIRPYAIFEPPIRDFHG